MEKETKEKKSILLREASQEGASNRAPHTMRSLKAKKLLIYVLMGIAFSGCLYLILRPDGQSENAAEAGLNKSVPQAGDAVLLGDKEKAYEQELLEKKEKERRQAMMTLSDYWSEGEDTSSLVQEGNLQGVPSNPASESVRNYREIQNTLQGFYRPEDENMALRREIRELREKVNAGSSRDAATDPIRMMEKSYEMAAKYLPQVLPQRPVVDSVKKSVAATIPERYVEPVYTARQKVVSTLMRSENPSNEELMASLLNQNASRLFDGQSLHASSQVVPNSIRACIHVTQTITIGSSIGIRLLEAARIARMTIPAGTLLTATAAIRDGRLGLQVTSVEYQGRIVPVDLQAYDLDGQPGLNLPYSPDVNALKEMASGMSTSAGTNIVLSSSTGQQLISDITKGVVQGTSGYLAKRIGTPKVTVKSGHLIFLLPQK